MRRVTSICILVGSAVALSLTGEARRAVAATEDSKPFVVSASYEAGRADAAIRVGKGAGSIATPLAVVRARSIVGSDTLVAGFGTDGVARVIDLASGEAWVLPEPALGDLPPMAAADGAVLVATNQGIARFDTGGRHVETVAVPEPVAGEAMVDGKPIKAVQPLRGAVSAIIRGNGVWYVLAENGVNAVFGTLDGSTRVDLPGYGRVLDAVMLHDVAVVAAWNPSRTPVGIDLVRIDDGKTAKSVATGYLVNQGTTKLNGAELVADGDRALLFLPTVDYTGIDLEVLPMQLAARIHPVPVRSILYQATLSPSGSLDVEAVKGIADNVGLHLTRAADGALYFFGGIAAERVTRLTIGADGAATTSEASELHAPARETVLVVK